jgi:hypothetical protein
MAQIHIGFVLHFSTAPDKTGHFRTGQLQTSDGGFVLHIWLCCISRIRNSTRVAVASFCISSAKRTKPGISGHRAVGFVLRVHGVFKEHGFDALRADAERRQEIGEDIGGLKKYMLFLRAYAWLGE